MRGKKKDNQCRRCLYRYIAASGEICFCNYILLVGHKRPCEPPPNCTVFRPYNKSERLKLDNARVRREAEQNE